jgi:thiamine-phosphate pyrophosphorylase
MTAGELRRALRLVVILDHAAARGRDYADLARSAARGGATMLQIRAKPLSAAELAAAVRAATAAAPLLPVIVNDRLDVALATGAAGCHLGQDDIPAAEGRRIAPEGFVIGGSAGDLAEVRRVLDARCDYIGIGPVHVTPNKPDAGAPLGVAGFAAVRAAAGSLPCVAIGGVTTDDIAALRSAGADGVAVIGAVLRDADVEAATRRLRDAIGR